MYGTMRSGAVPPINDIQLVEFLDNLNCSPERKELMTAALSLVGRVPYFWGGKSSAGWNETWNTPKVVTSIGSSTTGTLRPYGMDCTGFTEWVYRTALGVEIGTGSWNQWAKSTLITQDELLPGDLGFMSVPGTSSSQHVLIYAGKDKDGYILWVHCEWGYGVHISSPGYVKYYMRPNNIDLGG
jgi:cell wall-associated NlpC family hydrolase